MNETQWYCARCDVEMVVKRIMIIFMERVGFELAYVCPKCGAKFLSEHVVQMSILAKEKILETKLE